MQNANDDTAVIVQAEHRDAVANIEAIVTVDGVDGVLIGPYDLSASLGLPGVVDHPDVKGAIERVRMACKNAWFNQSAFSDSPPKPFGHTSIKASP